VHETDLNGHSNILIFQSSSDFNVDNQLYPNQSAFEKLRFAKQYHQSRLKSERLPTVALSHHNETKIYADLEICNLIIITIIFRAIGIDTTTAVPQTWFYLLAIRFIQGASGVPMLLRISLRTLPSTMFIILAVTVVTCGWLLKQQITGKLPNLLTEGK
jgi:hypothetical protein